MTGRYKRVNIVKKHLRFVVLTLAATWLLTASIASATLITNGDFETGDLAGWTWSGIDGGFATVVQEGRIFSAYDSSAVTLDGHFAANVRSVVKNPTRSEERRVGKE